MKEKVAFSRNAGALGERMSESWNANHRSGICYSDETGNRMLGVVNSVF
jgi:hypothetical protein